MPASAKSDLSIITAAGFVCAMTVGFIGVILAVLLFRNGFTSVQIGLVIGAGLAGAAVATSFSVVFVDRVGRRGSLALLSELATVPIFALAWRSTFAPLLLLAFVGMLNAMGSDRSASSAIGPTLDSFSTQPAPALPERHDVLSPVYVSRTCVFWREREEKAKPIRLS